jgi:hypothetical protein
VSIASKVAEGKYLDVLKTDVVQSLIGAGDKGTLECLNGMRPFIHSPVDGLPAFSVCVVALIPFPKPPKILASASGATHRHTLAAVTMPMSGGSLCACSSGRRRSARSCRRTSRARRSPKTGPAGCPSP